MDSTEQDRTHNHYRGLLGRLEDEQVVDRLVADGHVVLPGRVKPLTQRQIDHDRSLASYDRALGEGRN